MGPYVGFTGVREIFGERATLWIELLLGTPVVLWSCWPFLVGGWNSFRMLNLNMFSLTGMGVSAAWIFSVVAVLVSDVFSDGFRNGEGHVGVYFEAAAAIVTLVLLGQVMELRAREDTGRAIRALLDLAARVGRVIRTGGNEEEIPLEDVAVGDRLRVRPGCRWRSISVFRNTHQSDVRRFCNESVVDFCCPELAAPAWRRYLITERILYDANTRSLSDS